MAFLCGPKKDHSHDYAFQGRACFEGRLHPCFWLVLVDTEDGPQSRDCGAEAVEYDWGFECAKGHRHVNQETQSREGWAYAEDAGEAEALQKAGVIPFCMDGSGVFYDQGAR